MTILKRENTECHENMLAMSVRKQLEMYCIYSYIEMKILFPKIEYIFYPLVNNIIVELFYVKLIDVLERH